MNPLQSRLAALRRRLRMVVTVRGGCLAATLLLGCLAFAGLVDCAVYRMLGVETWSLLRAAILVSTLAGTGAVVYLTLLRPLAARTDDLSLALRVEEQYPILNDALASTVQFLEQQGQGKTAVSPSLQKEAVQRALRLAQGCDFFKVVNARGLRWSAALLMLMLVLVVPLVLLRPAIAKTALARIADPFGDHPWHSIAALTRLEVNCPPFLAYGQPLVITGEVSGEITPKVTVEFDNAAISTRTADVKLKTNGIGVFAFNIKLENPPREIRLRVRAGDAVWPKQTGAWHVVTLRQPPQLVALGGKPSPQITLEWPRYADSPPRIELPPGTGNIEVLAGTVVTFKAAADRPIERAWVEFTPEAPGTNEALALAAIGPRNPLEALITTSLSYSVWGKIPGKVEKNGTEFTVRFLPWVTGAYVLTIQDKDGLAKSYSFDQVVENDPVPVVEILRPAIDQSVLANAEVSLAILARDEKFALKSVWLEYRRKDKHGAWIDSAANKLLFYDHEKAGWGLPQLLNTLAAKPVLFPAEPLRLRPKQLLITHRWSLKGLAVEGETLVIQACADDFCDVIAFRKPGRSIEIELKVVGKAALKGVIEDAESKIQQQLIRLREMQDKAIKKVIGAEQQWRATGKLRPEDLIEVAEAEQLQKEIEARIGTKKDEGLRDEIAQLELLMKDNKLPRSEISERLKLLRETLEKIGQENLPKIELNLGKARRELEAPQKVEPPSPKDLGELGTARVEQEKVYRTLDELLQYMQEQATLAQIKGELRAILKEQIDLHQAVEVLLDNVLKHNKDWLKGSQPKADLRKAALLQRRLADRTQKLLDRIEQLRESVTGTDDALAEMLAKALTIARDPPPPPPRLQDLAAEMYETANIQLRDAFDLQLPRDQKDPVREPNLPRALSNQKECIETLQAMLEALDQKRSDQIERLIKRQKKAENNLDDLAAKLAKLQARIEAANKIENPLERDQALKKLADEYRALAQVAAKKAQDLDRLQAPDAAMDLDAASKKLQRVAMELDDGKVMQEDLNQAKKNFDDAKNKLKDAQDEAGEELSREQIARIVDLLQGLKERQDAAIDEAQRLHKQVLQANQWKRQLLDSLLADGQTQVDLAKETGGLRDKLKGAKVYHMVLDRAAKAMETAADKIKAHQEYAVPLQDQKALNEKQMDQEKLLVKDTVRYQKEASERLDHLIEALLPELERPKLDAENNGGGGGGPQPKPGLKAQDGIPPVAQLKVLKAEQEDINKRTKEFADRKLDLNNLTREEHAELMAIHAEQERLLDLFREMITSANEGGKQP
jgi:hypothetical protein